MSSSVRGPLRRGTCVALLLGLMAILPSLALGLGQPTTGFNEVSGLNVDNITVRDAAWNLQTSMAFSPGETIHVNVTSTTVDWIANAAGGGRLQLILQDYKGTTLLGPAAFSQVGQTPSRYTSTMALTGLQPDWYYLRVRIDDTARAIDARVAITVGSPATPHGLETFTDDTFTQASEVFTSSSIVWVRVTGDIGGDPNWWDLYSYQGASVVGGAQGGFSNFQRNGNVYYFSIDLSRFGPFTQGWFYTLEVSLRNGAFANGKQLEVFDPPVTFTRTDLAPARAFQGQVAVPMMELHLALNPNWNTVNGPAAFNLERLRFTRTGTAGANSDVVGIRIYRDVNADGVVGAGDTLLASRIALGGLGSPTWVGTDGLSMVYLIPGQTLHLLVAYDISPTAVVGDLQGVSLAAATDVDFHGSVVAGGPPLTSSASQVAGAVVTTATNAGLAPGFVSQGQTGVAMDLLTLSTNGPTVYLSSITVTLTGSGNVADVASVSLYRDDGDGVFRSNFDTLLSMPTAFQPSGTVTFGGLAVGYGTTGVDLWIVYDVAPGAGLGHLLESTIASNASFVVSQGWVLNQGFPLASGQSVVQGPTLLVALRDLLLGAPPIPQGRTNLPVLSLNLTTAAANVTLTALRVNRLGSASDLDVPRLKVWRDANGNGVLDLADTLVASGAFVGGTVTFAGLSLVVPHPGYVLLFLAVDISPTATATRTLGLTLLNPSYVTVAPPAVVDGAPFPLASSTATVAVAASPPATLTISRVDLVGQGLILGQGQTRVPFLRLTLTVNANTATLTDLRVDRLGTTSDADVPQVSLWKDANSDAQLDTAVDLILGTRGFRNGVAVFSALNLAVTLGTATDLFLTVDISPTAAAAGTAGLAVMSVDSVALLPPADVGGTTFPLTSSLATIEQAYGGGSAGSLLLYLGLAAFVAAIVLALLFLMGKGRHQCQVCHGPAPRGEDICPKCRTESASSHAGEGNPPPRVP